MEGMAESVTSPLVSDSPNPTNSTQASQQPSIPPTQTAQKPPLNKKETAKKETVWNFFEKVEIMEEGVKVKRAKCSICYQLMVHGGTAGTSHLRRHWEHHIRSQSVDIRTQMQLGSDSSGNVSNWIYDKETARSEVVDYVIRAEQPFTFVEKHDFVGMIQRAFAPQFTGISTSTCKRDVMKLFIARKNELLKTFESFEGKICLTSDCWSSRQKMGYMCLTAHFIDKNWNLNKRIIAFKMVEHPHTGYSLATHINEELISWRIHKKIFSISLDNATNNDVVAELLPDFLMIDSVSSKLFHVRCCAHILNLIVQDGLSLLSPSIEKITNIVRSMNSSNKKHELWIQYCKDLHMTKRNIDNDVPHRWNSTYELLQVAIHYKVVLNRYVQKLIASSRSCSLALPSEEDWFIATIVSRFLKIFDSSTKILCGVYYPTSCRVIPALVSINATFNKYAHYSVISAALDAMKSKFSKYWGTFPLIFCLAVAMDPRKKNFAIAQWMKSMDVEDLRIEYAISSVKQQLFELHEAYKANVVPLVPTSNSQANLSSTIPASGIDLIALPPDLEDYAEEVLKKAKTSSSTSSAASSDLQYYIDMPTLETADGFEFNLLGWWRSHEEVYPVLSLIARDLLTVPASTVASEAAFSASGRVVSERRASLSPNTIEALICLKDWKLADAREQYREQEEDEDIQNIKLSRLDWMIAVEDAQRDIATGVETIPD